MKNVLIVLIALAVYAFGFLGVKASDDIWGKIEKVDGKDYTIHASNSNIGQFIVWVDSDTVIKENGQRIHIEDIKPDDKITATVETVSDNHFLGVEIIVDKFKEVCPQLNGYAQKVDSENRKIAVWSNTIGDFNVIVGDNATVLCNGKPSKIDKIQLGDMIWFKAKKNSDGSYIATNVDAWSVP
jgi:hypothetical protein